MDGIDWPAWVQAVGSVLALLLTGGLAVWETRRRRMEERGRVADLLRARVAVLDFASNVAASFVEEHAGDGRTKFVAATASYEKTAAAIAVADSVTVLDMPTKKCVDYFFLYSASTRPFRDVIAQHKPSWLHLNEVARLALPRDGLRMAVAALNEEAERIARGG